MCVCFCSLMTDTVRKIPTNIPLPRTPSKFRRQMDHRRSLRAGLPLPPEYNPYMMQLNAEIELRQQAEGRANSYMQETQRLKERLKEANAALSEQEGAVDFLQRGSSFYYREAQVLRRKLCRWDERNWAELVMTALAGSKNGSSSEVNYIHDVTDTLSFAPELRLIHQRRDQACCDWLAQHAYHPAKCLLVKMAHRLSGRRTGWQHSIFKYDHSVRDAEGKRKRTRELMAEDPVISWYMPVHCSFKPRSLKNTRQQHQDQISHTT